MAAQIPRGATGETGLPRERCPLMRPLRFAAWLALILALGPGRYRPPLESLAWPEVEEWS